ncbi:MAG: ParB-like chromosome segregation protein Spo0J [Cellvibrionaceae bacterium]|jgi:ParB-like chromosome segregation protein Spo0J
MAKKTGVRLGLKNLGVEPGGEATGLEEIFGLASTPDSSNPPRRNRRSKTVAADDSNAGPTFGEIDILAARPDPSQPRTLLPASAYTAMDQGALPQTVITDWLGSKETASPAQQEEMTEIEALAATIETAGLQQPIGIREIASSVTASSIERESKPESVQYAVVFGERRWWAHVYLLSADNNALGQDVGKIKAGLVQPSNLQLVQLIENLHRRNLPPLDLAIGLQGSYDTLKAAGVKNPWQQIEIATGIGRAQRSRYLHLIELAPEVQQKMQDHMVTENAIRPIADRLRKEAASLQVSAINTLLKWRANDQPAGPKQLNKLIDQLLAGESPSSQKGTRSSSGGLSAIATQIVAKAKAARKTLDSLDSNTTDQFRIYLNNEPQQALNLVTLRNRLNQLLNDVMPGQLFLVQANGGWLELSAEDAAAGYLAFESYLEAAAENGEVVEHTFEEAQAIAGKDGMVLWVAGTDGEIRAG